MSGVSSKLGDQMHKGKGKFFINFAFSVFCYLFI